MPSPRAFGQPRPFHAEVHPLLSSSSSKPPISQIATASTSLWQKLSLTSRKGGAEPHTQIAVAVEWPEDRRLGKGKQRSLVVYVEEEEGDRTIANSTSLAEDRLYIHPSLLPPFSPTPLAVLVHPHEPFHLTLAILQPVLDSASSSSPDQPDSTGDLDFTSVFTPPPETRNAAQGSDSPEFHYPPILREGDIIPIPTIGHDGTQGRYRLLLLEPVSQGILTPSTRVILSTTPYLNEPNGALYDGLGGDGVLDDGNASEESYAQTHLSLSMFDADAFLSSSLSLNLSQEESFPDGDLSGDIETGHSQSSSTSGSLTPRPGGGRGPSPPAVLDDLMPDEPERGARFTPVRASGPACSDDPEGDVCWLGVGGLGRAGIFEGDWVIMRRAGEAEGSGSGRLVKALAWERLDEPDDDLPSNSVLIPPSLHRSLLPNSTTGTSVILQPTPFSARSPTLPIARTITLARMATAEGSDKRYERAWLKGLKRHFEPPGVGGKDDVGRRLVRRGDIISVPIWPAKPISSHDDEHQSEDDDEDSFSVMPWSRAPEPTAVGYFTITSLSYDPLVPLEEDFRSSISSKARAGELGCWADVGEDRVTKMVLTGVEKARVDSRAGDLKWHNIESAHPPFSLKAATTLRDLLQSCFAQTSLAFAIQLSVLVKGARGSGKRSLIQSISDELGYNIVAVECYDIIGDTPTVTSGSLLARLDKAKACSPSLLVLNHIEALAKKTESTVLGRPPPIVKVIEEVMRAAKAASVDGWPVIVLGTTADVEAVPNELAGCFKQEVEIKAPNEAERLAIVQHTLDGIAIAPDIDLAHVARQTAALHAGDIVALLHRARDLSLARISVVHSEAQGRSPKWSTRPARLAGLSLTSADLDKAIADARSTYSDSIGAPKIPNVSWDDVGGLVSVKQDILDTIQLPLERPELFGEGLKKRSGILLYGPPGTGKTLLAKAVATSCSLNFLSVKGPELLNMYIGESEANVRRLFQRARDASPCVIFMDELDSLAPKRGNQGDSAGVMDRIVSQLLAELDGMSSTGGQVFVLGATNRPDLLDPALLRPGRFDKMLYLSVPTTHQAQSSILQALTRKFDLDPALELARVAERCQFNYTGADLYALCSDAMLNAMTRTAGRIDDKIAHLNSTKEGRSWTGELTPQYYLAKMASQEEMQVRVTEGDFEDALARLTPSVSQEEMGHYERVQREFKGFEIGQKGVTSAGGGYGQPGRRDEIESTFSSLIRDRNGGEMDVTPVEDGAEVKMRSEGKGKAKMIEEVEMNGQAGGTVYNEGDDVD